MLIVLGRMDITASTQQMDVRRIPQPCLPTSHIHDNDITSVVTRNHQASMCASYQTAELALHRFALMHACFVLWRKSGGEARQRTRWPRRRQETGRGRERGRRSEGGGDGSRGGWRGKAWREERQRGKATREGGGGRARPPAAGVCLCMCFVLDVNRSQQRFKTTAHNLRSSKEAKSMWRNAVCACFTPGGGGYPLTSIPRQNRNVRTYYPAGGAAEAGEERAGQGRASRKRR